VAGHDVAEIRIRLLREYTDEEYFIAPQRGCTMMCSFCIAESAGAHQRRWCCETTAQICSGEATASARFKASCSNESPPRNEQNCLEIATPDAVVVRLRRRLPSPPASTIAQAFPAVSMISAPVGELV
jgi:hypothetical protein